VKDSVEDMYNYLRQEVKGTVSAETLRDFCQQSAANLQWLEQHGVPFEGSLCPTKTSYPTDRHYLYYSGNESFSPYKDHARPAPRGHRVRRPGVSGAGLFEPLRAQVERRDIRVRDCSRVERLVLDEDDRVVGVEVQQVTPGLWQTLLRWLMILATGLRYLAPLDQPLYRLVFAIERSRTSRRRVRARRGVILATGGFINNQKMMEQHAPKYRGGMPLGSAADDGSGILLGQSAGGAVAKMSRATAWCFVNPPLAFTSGILVNRNGQRIINELLYGASVGEAVIEKHDSSAFLILDEELKERATDQCTFAEMQWFQVVTQLRNLWFNCKGAQTVDALARRIGVSASGLCATIEQYNAGCASGRDAMDKPAAYLHPLTRGPYYAIDCSRSSKHFVWPTLTLGGLLVDEQTGHVQRADGSRIAGLYAAGRSAVGIPSQQYMSGLSLADCVYSGRRAGREAALADQRKDQGLPPLLLFAADSEGAGPEIFAAYPEPEPAGQRPSAQHEARPGEQLG